MPLFTLRFACKVNKGYSVNIEVLSKCVLLVFNNIMQKHCLLFTELAQPF